MSAEQNVAEAPVEHRSSQGTGESEGYADEAFEGEDGSRTSPGMGQSKSSRRRRRKRKGKGDGADDGFEGGAASATGDGGQAPAAQQSNAQASSNQSFSNQGSGMQGSGMQGGGQGSQQPRSNNGGGSQQPRGFSGPASVVNQAPGQGVKKWKKKFRERDRRGSDNFGNQGSGGGYARDNSGGYQGGSRDGNGDGGRDYSQSRDRDSFQPGNVGGVKRKSSGFSSGSSKRSSSSAVRGFVGPMDHSYRAINGSFSEAPPSTIDTSTGYGFAVSSRRFTGDSQPVDYSQARSIPIAENAPTRIYFFIEDLFFIAKIGETARKLGIKVAFIKNEKESIAALTGGENEDQKPSLIVFDLNNANAKPLTLIPKLRTKLKKSVSIVGFLSHLQGDLKAKAVEAGCDTVMPRAAFSQNLPNLLRRYGMDDAEEANFNQ